MLAEYGDIFGIRPFGHTSGVILSFLFWTVKSHKHRMSRPSMGDRDADILHLKMDMEKVIELWTCKVDAT